MRASRCLKPQTYMNDSGRSVGEALRFHKLDLGALIVIHDELDLAPAKVSVKVGGGNAGHNGLRSISAHVGNDYKRVRIGIGHPGDKALVYHYVLSDFAKSEAGWVEAVLPGDRGRRAACSSRARTRASRTRRIWRSRRRGSARSPAPDGTTSFLPRVRYEPAHFDREALDRAVEADGDPGQDGDLVLDRADAVELTGEEVEGDVGHLGDYASLDGCWPAASDLDGRIVD